MKLLHLIESGHPVLLALNKLWQGWLQSRSPLLIAIHKNGIGLETYRHIDHRRSTVVDANVYTDPVKFFYLQSHLKGEAAALLEGIPLDGKNFTAAWNILKSNFDNKRLMIDASVKNLLSLNHVQKESSSDLRTDY